MIEHPMLFRHKNTREEVYRNVQIPNSFDSKPQAIKDAKAFANLIAEPDYDLYKEYILVIRDAIIDSALGFNIPDSAMAFSFELERCVLHGFTNKLLVRRGITVRFKNCEFVNAYLRTELPEPSNLEVTDCKFLNSRLSCNFRIPTKSNTQNILNFGGCFTNCTFDSSRFYNFSWHRIHGIDMVAKFLKLNGLETLAAENNAETLNFRLFDTPEYDAPIPQGAKGQDAELYNCDNHRPDSHYVEAWNVLRAMNCYHYLTDPTAAPEPIQEPETLEDALNHQINRDRDMRRYAEVLRATDQLREGVAVTRPAVVRTTATNMPPPHWL